MHLSYIHNQSILLQTISQPNKLTVPSPYTGSLLSKTHAICLQREKSMYYQINFQDMNNQNLELPLVTLACKQIS